MQGRRQRLLPPPSWPAGRQRWRFRPCTQRATSGQTAGQTVENRARARLFPCAGDPAVLPGRRQRTVAGAVGRVAVHAQPHGGRLPPCSRWPGWQLGRRPVKLSRLQGTCVFCPPTAHTAHEQGEGRRRRGKTGVEDDLNTTGGEAEARVRVRQLCARRGRAYSAINRPAASVPLLRSRRSKCSARASSCS